MQRRRRGRAVPVAGRLLGDDRRLRRLLAGVRPARRRHLLRSRGRWCFGVDAELRRERRQRRRWTDGTDKSRLLSRTERAGEDLPERNFLVIVIRNSDCDWFQSRPIIRVSTDERCIQRYRRQISV